MMYLTNYKEFGGDTNKSIIECFNDSKYESQEEVLNFMKNSGEKISCCGECTDIITGENIGSRVTKKSGDFVWSSDLAYYVEKYNYKPPQEFINHILNKAV